MPSHDKYPSKTFCTKIRYPHKLVRSVECVQSNYELLKIYHFIVTQDIHLEAVIGRPGHLGPIVILMIPGMSSNEKLFH